MCWSVVFFSLAYWGIENIGKRKWGSTWSIGYSLQDKQIVVLNVVLWIWSCSSLNLSHMWHVILIYDLLQSWLADVRKSDSALLTCPCTFPWAWSPHAFPAECQIRCCELPIQIAPCLGLGFWRLAWKAFFFCLCNAFSFNLTLPSSYLLVVSVFRVLSLPVYVSARISDSYCSLKIECSSILSNISTRLAKLVQVKLYIACIYWTLRIWFFVRYSFNFSTGYGKQGIIFLNFFSSVQSLFSCVVPLWVLFYIYGFIVCESVILALARKEKIIASSVFRIRLFQKSDHLFCRGKRFMKNCEENWTAISK